VPQAVDATLTLTQAQFNQAVWYSGPSTEDLYLQVDDGQPGGAVSNEGHIVIHGAPDTAAIVTEIPGFDFYALHGQTFALTSLFTASDPDGDTITQYRIENTASGWDPGDAFGLPNVPNPSIYPAHWVVNGVAQPSGTWITISPSQLNSLYYQASADPRMEGAGPNSDIIDFLRLQANDGAGWAPDYPSNSGLGVTEGSRPRTERRAGYERKNLGRRASDSGFVRGPGCAHQHVHLQRSLGRSDHGI
jgi:hypothetical protein